MELEFYRSYTVTIAGPGCLPKIFSFDDPNDMEAFLGKKYEEQRNGQLSEDATIKSKITEDSLAGAVYAKLRDQEYEEIYTCEECEEAFYDEKDEEGDPMVSTWAMMNLIDHVVRLNDFHNGNLQFDYLLEVLDDYDRSYEEIGSYYLLPKKDFQRFKETDVGTLNFEDGSKLFILNADNSIKQQQAFKATLILWRDGKYVL